MGRKRHKPEEIVAKLRRFCSRSARLRHPYQLRRALSRWSKGRS